jgi:hypothetical protein
MTNPQSVAEIAHSRLKQQFLVVLAYRKTSSLFSIAYKSMIIDLSGEDLKGDLYDFRSR